MTFQILQKNLKNRHFLIKLLLNFFSIFVRHKSTISRIRYQIQKKLLKIFIDFTRYFYVVASILVSFNSDIFFQEFYTIDNLDFIRKKILETRHIFAVDVAKSTQMFIYTLIFIKTHLFETNEFDFDNNL